MWFNGSPTKVVSFSHECTLLPSYVYNMHQDTKSVRLIAVCKRLRHWTRLTHWPTHPTPLLPHKVIENDNSRISKMKIMTSIFYWNEIKHLHSLNYRLTCFEFRAKHQNHWLTVSQYYSIKNFWYSFLLLVNTTI